MAVKEFFKKAVSDDVLALLHRIMLDPAFDDFYLVGGTALALQIGHRKSIDIDLFTGESFDADQISESFCRIYTGKEIVLERCTVRAIIDNIKIDVMTHKYPLLDPLEKKDAIRMASLKDIAAMKVNAIASRGSKKDFWDFAALLDFFTAEDMLLFFQSKYSNANVWHAEKSLSYFDDAELEPDPNDITGKTWEEIRLRINGSLKS
ncbi:MAG: nucleotidyl transferase AbiEii/AbiGii toxin family protein [Smithella sp.]